MHRLRLWIGAATLAAVGSTVALAGPQWRLIYYRQIGNFENAEKRTIENHLFNEDGSKAAGVGVTNQSNVGSAIFGNSDADGWHRIAPLDVNNCAYDIQIHDPGTPTELSPDFFWYNPGATPEFYSYITHWIKVSEATDILTNPANAVYDYDLMNGEINGVTGLNDITCEASSFVQPAGVGSDRKELAGVATWHAQTFVVPQNVNRIISAQAFATREIISPAFAIDFSIRDGGPDGPQIGPTKTSRPKSAAEFKELAVSWGLDDVEVVPGQTYALRIEANDAQPLNVWASNDSGPGAEDVYPDGALFSDNVEQTDQDMFATVVGVGRFEDLPLLINGGFEGAGSPCSPGNGWSLVPGTNNCVNNSTIHPPFDGPLEGSQYGSTDEGNPPTGRLAAITQTVQLPESGNLRLTGGIAGASTVGTSDHFIRLHDGPDHTSPILAQELIQQNLDWNPIDLQGVPTGSEVTVSWGFDNVVNIDWNPGTGTHVDGLSLTQAQAGCSGDPIVDSLSPGFAANDGPVNVTVVGSNFDGTSQVILRRSGTPQIEATGESVNPAGTMITCSLPITGAKMGKWNVVVTKDTCNEGTLSNAFLVALPELTNGSFEDPFVSAASCPNPPAPLGKPDNWLDGGVSTRDDHFGRDSDLSAPSCPRPEGKRYASISIPDFTFFSNWSAFQHITVTPGQEVTVCGDFAGGGRLSGRLQLFDGDENGVMLDEQLIIDRDGCPGIEFDWSNACATGTSTSGLLTVRIRMGAHSDPPIDNALHFDNLQLFAGGPPVEICNDQIDNDGDRATDCQDADCAADNNCGPTPVEICDNGIDDDGDIDIDCDDSDCDSACVEICTNGIDDDQDCEVDEGCEDCDNLIDDNGNNLVDCEDPDCAAWPGCVEICDNGIDDDGDQLVDCLDPVCVGTEACPCNDPFADADGDNDVDQDDFGLLQLCVTGELGGGTEALPPECVCFDRNGDRDVDQADFQDFTDCAGGPNVPFDALSLPNCGQ